MSVKKIKLFLSNIFVYALILYLLINSKTCITSIKQSTELFLNKLIPALFPFILITELLINFNFIQNLTYGIDKVICKIFRLQNGSSLPVVAGYLLGYPNAAKIINSLYFNKNISSNTAKHLTSFVNNANMSYIISSVGISMYYNIKIGIILLISHFLSSIIIGIFYPVNNSKCIIQQKNIISNTFSKSYFEIILKSILNSIKTLAIIFSFTVIFSLIPAILLKDLPINCTLKTIFKGVFEISNGMYEISLLNISIAKKLILSSFILSFSSLMVIFQVYSYLYTIGIKFKDLIKYKLLQGILSSIITFILLQFFKIRNVNFDLNVYNSYDKYLTKTVILPSTIYIFSVVITLVILYIINNKKK